MTLLERFTRKVATPREASGCWEWTGPRALPPRLPYGRFKANGKTRYAHRVSYELFVGPVPDGLQLDHLCRNPSCVRPDHLEPVTARENLMRGETHAAANAAKTHCPKGHEYSPANTQVNRSGSRVCRACNRAANNQDHHRARRLAHYHKKAAEKRALAEVQVPDEGAARPV